MKNKINVIVGAVILFAGTNSFAWSFGGVANYALCVVENTVSSGDPVGTESSCRKQWLRVSPGGFNNAEVACLQAAAAATLQQSKGKIKSASDKSKHKQVIETNLNRCKK